MTQITSSEWNKHKEELVDILEKRAEKIMQQILIVGALLNNKDGEDDIADKLKEISENYQELFQDFFNSGALIAVALVKMQISTVQASIPSEYATDPEKLKEANKQQRMFTYLVNQITNLIADMSDKKAFEYSAFIKTDK